MKANKLQGKVKWTLLTGMIIFVLCAYNNPKNEPGKFIFRNTGSVTNVPNVINVSNVAELYTAVNDVKNEGKKIVLATGTYTLEPTQPNGGRLELQRNMDLIGQIYHPELVLIDASALPPTSFPPAPNRSGAIRIGKGSNKIEWLSIKGNNSTPNALSAIDTDLDTGPAEVRLAHLIVTNSLIGIDIRNRQAINAGRVLKAEIFNNELKDNPGQGIAIQNSVGATGAIIKATLKENYSHDNQVGLRVHDQHTDLGKITISSNNDQFDGNGIGLVINSGADINQVVPPVTTANGNKIIFNAQNSSFSNNKGTPPPDAPPAGGIFAVGGFSRYIPNRASDNKLEINLSKCTITGNQGPYDINAFGAYSYSGANAGTNNVVIIRLCGMIKNASMNITQSFPAEPAGTNTLDLF